MLFYKTEAILRIVMEGSIKLAYIACEPELVSRKIKEYTCILPKINSIKRNGRIEHILESVDVFEKTSNIFNNILQCEFPDFNGEMNRKARKEIENKWAFNSMINKIEKCSLKEINGTTILRYPYGMMSHIVHMDNDGLQLIWERFSREEQDLKKVTKGQISRQLSDIYLLMFLRTLSIYLIYDTDYKELLELRNKHKKLLIQIDELKEK